MEKQHILRQIKIKIAQNDCAGAVDLAKKGFKDFKDNCFLNEIAKICVGMGNRKDAINYLKKIYKNDPNNLSNIKLLAYNLFAIGKFKEALKYYNLILDFEPQVAENYFNVASMYHFLKKRKEAWDYYNFAININPKYVSAINNLGLLYYENKYYKEAVPYFKKAIKISPEHPEAYHHLGVIYREYYNDLNMSKYYLKKALIMDSKYPINSYQLEKKNKKTGNLAEAKKLFMRCLELQPNNKDAEKELVKLNNLQ